MATSATRRWFIVLLKTAVTISLIWLVLREVELQDTVRHLQGLSFGSIALVLGLLAVQGAVGAWRWTFVVGVFGWPLPFLTALRLYFEGLFFNQALPSTIGGDAVRMYRCNRAGMPVGAAVNGVLLDRIGGVSGLLILVALSQPLAWQRLPDFGPRVALAVMLLAGGAAIATLLLMASLPDRWRRWRIIVGVAALSVGARRMYRSIAIVTPVLGLSLAIQIITVLAVFVLVRDLELPVSFYDCLVLIPLVFLAATIPISIAGWGVREGAMVTALGLIDVSVSGALTVSVIFGLGLVAIGLVGGIIWLARGDHRLISADEINQLTDSDSRSA